ncbi:response regulator, partial [Eggerthella sinensis]|uniref:response regulator n=1 Tax=Eggerthella sinensis TaxID=242230 RepID=UPI0022E1DBBD
EASALARSYDNVDEDMREKTAFIASDARRRPRRRAGARGGLRRPRRAAEAARDPRARPVRHRRGDQAFTDERINPAIEDLLGLDIGILDQSTASVEELYTVVTDVGMQTIAWAVALMAGVTVSVGAYLVLIRRNRKSEDKLRADLQEALALAQTASAAKSQFLSNMSHDIRTPMNAIVGLTSIAEAHLEEPEHVAVCLDRIKTSSRHLLSLINDVLDMGKIESGKIVLNEDRFSFPEFVNGIVTIAQPQAQAKQLTLDITIGNVQQENVIGDSMRLNQALINLVSNAVKYTPEGGTVRLSLTEEPSRRAGHHNYRFVVQDTGYGMTPEFVERLFDPFEREESAETKRIEGTGLGMAITKNVVDMMGGTIEVESAPGEGSTFTVVVPLVPVKDAEEDFALGTLEAARVLVVDDDAQVVEGTLLILDELGLRGDAATSGAQAVSLVAGAHDEHDEHDDFRFIIVDWIMPGMDGIETVRRIRAEAGDSTPIVLLTAYDWADIEDEARAAGVSAFVSKPLFKSRLHRVLKEFADLDGAGSVEQPRAEGHVVGRVLLVEDNLLNREIASELIRTIGAEVEQAHDGRRPSSLRAHPHHRRRGRAGARRQKAVEAAGAAPEGYFDLVFMDMQMPLMNGIEATRAIRAGERAAGRGRVPIVAMTANAFTEDREQALEAGMDGFMTKPIDLGKLRRVLEEYLPENAE